MQKVILSKENEKYIESSQIDDDSHIGIIWRFDERKTWITSNGNNGFISVKIGDYTLQSKFGIRSKKQYVEYALNEIAEVFSFDTSAELVKWLTS